MKYLRYYIIFGITLLLLIYILFFYKGRYLAIFEDDMTINYSSLSSAECNWEYENSNKKSLILYKNSDNEWGFIPGIDGKTTLVFNCVSSEKKNIYEITYILKIKDDKIYWQKGSGKGLLDFPNPY